MATGILFRHPDGTPNEDRTVLWKDADLLEDFIAAGWKEGAIVDLEPWLAPKPYWAVLKYRVFAIHRSIPSPKLMSIDFIVLEEIAQN